MRGFVAVAYVINRKMRYVWGWVVHLVEIRQCDVCEVCGKGGGDGMVVRADEGKVGEIGREGRDRIVERAFYGKVVERVGEAREGAVVKPVDA